MKRVVAQLSVCLALWGCVEPTSGAPLPADILAFIGREELRRVQRVDLLLDVPSEQAQLFRVVYGDSFPVMGLCEGGCGYAFPSAVGLRLRSHVGWLEAADTTLRHRFDVSTSDEYLFTEDFFTRFADADVILFQQPFKSLLATDADTPDGALWLLVDGLSSWISPSLATHLLDNARVAQNRPMLLQMSALPVFQGDAYKEARERAAFMLAGAP